MKISLVVLVVVACLSSLSAFAKAPSRAVIHAAVLRAFHASPVKARLLKDSQPMGKPAVVLVTDYADADCPVDQRYLVLQRVKTANDTTGAVAAGVNVRFNRCEVNPAVGIEGVDAIDLDDVS